MPRNRPKKTIEIRKNSKIAEIVAGGIRERVESFDFPAIDGVPPSRPESPVAGFAFGDPDASAENASSLTLLRGDGAPGGAGFLAAQVFSVEGVEPGTVSLDGKPVGFLYEDDTASFCRLRGVTSDDPTLSPKEQTARTFERVSRALESAGFAFSDVVRTWCYLDGLLEWYGEFNAARNAFFESEGVFEGLVPASTGIGAGNVFGTALVVDVLAARPKNGVVGIRSVESPMQNPALDYKSSFSRAVEIEVPGCRSLLVSGTASIDGGGKSVRLGDLHGQIELTLDVLEALLESRGMSWKDAFRGIAYFKNAADLGELEPIMRRRKIPEFSLISVPAAVCRDELLFELELDAVKTE